MQGLHLLEMHFERLHSYLWEHRHTILLAFPIPHQDLAVLKVRIFDPQANAFH